MLGMEHESSARAVMSVTGEPSLQPCLNCFKCIVLCIKYNHSCAIITPIHLCHSSSCIAILHTTSELHIHPAEAPGNPRVPVNLTILVTPINGIKVCVLIVPLSFCTNGRSHRYRCSHGCLLPLKHVCGILFHYERSCFIHSYHSCCY